jgi:hypothetical protein
MIHTPNGEIRLHQIITHSVSPGSKSQILNVIISKQRRIDSRSHYYLHIDAIIAQFHCAHAVKKALSLLLAKFSA